MTIKAKFLFVLLGNGGTGKTALQKLLINRLCGHSYGTLPVNRFFPIIYPEVKRKYETASFSNRSLQEKMSTYESIENYFANHFEDADIAFVASHLDVTDVEVIIRLSRQKYYNVYGVFWSNSIAVNPSENSLISALDWNERFVITNPNSADNEQIEKQLNAIADSIITLIINRTGIS